MADETPNDTNVQTAEEAAGQPDDATISGKGEPVLPEIAEEPSAGPGVPTDPPSGLGTVLTPGEPNFALDELDGKEYKDEHGEKVDGGLLEDETPRKDDASHAELSRSLAEDGELSHEQLDQIEARQDVSDIRLLVAYLRKHLTRQTHREEKASDESSDESGDSSKEG